MKNLGTIEVITNFLKTTRNNKVIGLKNDLYYLVP